MTRRWYTVRVKIRNPYLVVCFVILYPVYKNKVLIPRETYVITTLHCVSKCIYDLISTCSS